MENKGRGSKRHVLRKKEKEEEKIKYMNIKTRLIIQKPNRP